MKKQNKNKKHLIDAKSEMTGMLELSGKKKKDFKAAIMKMFQVLNLVPKDWF